MLYYLQHAFSYLFKVTLQYLVLLVHLIISPLYSKVDQHDAPLSVSFLHYHKCVCGLFPAQGGADGVKGKCRAEGKCGAQRSRDAEEEQRRRNNRFVFQAEEDLMPRSRSKTPKESAQEPMRGRRAASWLLD